ncbi:MAG: lipopolysaccharide biosynthesis protein [Solitalea-like symbiont of Tyrophagus putrescentiae]
MRVSFNLKSFIKNTFIYGFSSVLARILNFLLTPLYVRSFDTNEYGTIVLLFSWASILNAILAFGMETSFFRFLFDKYSKRQIYTNSFFVVFAISLLFILLTNTFIDPISQYIIPNYKNTNEYLLYIRLFSFILFFDAITIIPLAYLRARGMALRYSMIKALNIGIYIFLNILFIVFIPYYIKEQLPHYEIISRYYKADWVGYVFIANLISSAFSLLLLAKEFKKVIFKYVNISVISKLTKYSWPIMIANLSFIINENIDKIMLAKLLPDNISEQEVGIYGACSKIAIFLNIAIQAFRLGAEPIFFKHSKEQDANKLYANIMLYFVIAISIVAMIINTNIPILKYFIKANDAVNEHLYWSGLKVVPILLFAYICLGIYMNLSIWYKLGNKTQYGLYISGIGAIITITLNFILIPKYGYTGSAVTTLIVYFVMMSISYMVGQKHKYIPYNVRKICGYIILCIVINLLFFYTPSIHILLKNVGIAVIIATIILYEYKTFNSQPKY